MAEPTNIDAYIAAARTEVRPILEKVRRAIRKAAPDAEEVISYRMPAFRQHGILLFFAAFQNHIGLFPPVRGDAKLEREIAPFAGPKGNLRFPLDEPIPYALIERIARFRVQQDAARGRAGARRAQKAKAPAARKARPKPAAKKAKKAKAKSTARRAR